MTTHEYTPRQALDLLLEKVGSANEDLVDQVRSGIDVGKDVEEEEPPIGRRRKVRRYRKAVPFTDEEALRAALDVLQAYFVEQPLFVSSAMDDFRAAAIGEPTSERPSTKAGDLEGSTAGTSQDIEKALEVEPHAETQISRPSDEMLPLRRVDAPSVEEQKRNLEAVHQLIDFTGEQPDGDAG